MRCGSIVTVMRSLLILSYYFRSHTDTTPAPSTQHPAPRLRLERVDEELHHPILIHRGVAAVGADLDVEALARGLQRIDQLQRVGRMHVVVGGAVVDQQ